MRRFLTGRWADRLRLVDAEQQADIVTQTIA
jgi:hypothetical protein